MKGVQQTVALDTFKPPHLFQPLGGVAVIANTRGQRSRAAAKLKVEWNDGEHGAFDSDSFKQQMLADRQADGQGVSQPGKRRHRFAARLSLVAR